jgi:branched-chain amino acid transport system substrate-binding protein
VLLDESIEYDKSVCAGYDWEYPIAGGTIVGRDVYKNDDPAITSQVTRLAAAVKDQGVDNVMLCTFMPGGGSATRQIRAAGIDIPILAATGMDGLYWQSSEGWSAVISQHNQLFRCNGRVVILNLAST